MGTFSTSRSAVLGVLGAAVAYGVWASWVAWRDQFGAYHGDDWRILADFHANDLASWLFTPQNGHRVPATLALFALDHLAFGARSQLLVAASLLAAWTTAALLVWSVHRDRGALTPFTAACAAFACFLLFWSAGSYHLVWGMTHCNLWSTQWVLSALLALALHHRAQAEGAGRGSAWLAVTVVSATLATFGVGNGIAVWLGLLTMAGVARMSGRVVAVLVAGLAVCLVLYLRDLTGDVVAPRSGFAILLENPLQGLHFVTLFLGAAGGRAATALEAGRFASFETWSAAAGGLGLVAALAVLVALVRRGRDAGLLPLTALGLLAFAVVSAGIVAIARMPFAPEDDPLAPATAIRFLYWSGVFGLGLVLALVAFAPRTRVARAVVLALLATTCVAMQLGFEPAKQVAARKAASTARGWAGLLIGLRSPAVLHDVAFPYDDIGRVREVADRLARERRAQFASPRAALLGARVEQRFKVTPRDRCWGFLDRLDPIRGRPAASRARGRAWDVERDEAPLFVVLATESGVIQGLAGARRAPTHRPGRRRVLFGGYTLNPRARAAWAILDDGGACRLEDATSEPGARRSRSSR